MDRTSKLLMAAIAAGLFAHAIAQAGAANFKPDAYVSGPELREIAATLESIANGTCSNRKLCE